MNNIVKTALDKMSKVKKPQKTFICQLFLTLIIVQGKATFRNMSRYSSMSEERFRRWYRRTFDFFKLNCLILSDVLSLMGVVDLQSNTAYALDAQQTLDKKDKTRVDLYAEQVLKLAGGLLVMGINYLAVDAYYFKKKFVSAVLSAGLQIVQPALDV